jgi:hypothetical protein
MESCIRHDWKTAFATYRWWVPLLAIIIPTIVHYVPVSWPWATTTPVGDALLSLGVVLFLLAIARLLTEKKEQDDTAAPSFAWTDLGLCAAASCLAAGVILVEQAHFNSTALPVLEALFGASAIVGLVWRRLTRDLSTTEQRISWVQWIWIGVAGLIMFVPLWGTLSLVQQSQKDRIRALTTVPGGRRAIPFMSEEPFCYGYGRRNEHPPTAPVVVVSIDRIDPQAQAIAATAVLSVPRKSIGVVGGPDEPRSGSGADIGFIRLILRRNYDGTSYAQFFSLAHPSFAPIANNVGTVGNVGVMDLYPASESDSGVSKYLGCPGFTPFGAVKFGVVNEPELPVETDESLYPWDRYRFDYVVYVDPLWGNYAPRYSMQNTEESGKPTLPKNCTERVAARSLQLNLWQTPDVYVATTLGQDNLVQVASWRRDLCDNVVAPEIVVQISRAPLSILFVESVAAVPLLLFILVLETVVRWSRDRGPESGRAHRTETIALIGAAILAILPLRSVIVPAEITGLTRVDFELGLWLSAIIAIAVLEVAVNPSTGKAATPPGHVPT